MEQIKFIITSTLRRLVLSIANYITDKFKITQKFIINNIVIEGATATISIFPQKICPVSINLTDDTIGQVSIYDADFTLQFCLEMFK